MLGNILTHLQIYYGLQVSRETGICWILNSSKHMFEHDNLMEGWLSTYC